MLKPILPIFFFCFSILKLTNSQLTETQSLLEFKKGISGDPSGKVFNSWVSISSQQKPSSCPVSWYGISCGTSSSASVVSINLDHLALTGDLKFSTLIGLKMLQNLTLSGNYFTGRIPPVIGTMSTLQHLDLSDNHFVGSVPDRINDLWGLNYLNLSLNNFSGGIPTSRLQNLQQMRVFDLHSNDLWADVADIFSRLRNVEVIDLSDNSFYGDLSVSSNFSGSLYTTLHHLDLSRNGLNGGFFSEDAIVNFRNLVYLDLSENGLTGMLPSSFGNLPYLQVVRVRKNRLYGPVPQELFQSGIPLVELDLSGNGFTGVIPEMKSTTLRVLNVSSNGFSGSFPSSIGKCTIIDMSRNMMMGDISHIVNWEDTLEIVDLSSNKLSGSLPNLTSKFEKLNTLIVSNNALVGSLPPTLGTLSNLSKVDLGSNELSGPIPASFFVSTTLIYLNLSGNDFTGGIPLQGSRASELVVLPSFLPMETLDLSSNSLEGVFPSDIGNFGRLKFLNLSNNTLSGKLPNELGKLGDLLYLDLSRNNFEGEIPDNLPSSLQGFSVAYNDLSGRIPGKVKHFPMSSFKPGNDKLNVLKGNPKGVNGQTQIPGNHHGSKSSIRVAIIVASVGAAVMIVFVLLAYYRSQIQDFHGRSAFGGQTAARDMKIGIFSKPSIFSFHSNSDPPPTSLSFSHDHLLTANSRSMSGPVEYPAEIVEHVVPVASSSLSMIPNILDAQPASATSGRKSSPGSPLSASPHFTEIREKPVMLDVYSPDRLAGELFFLDASLAFTAEELSRAPAEVLGRSSHGTLYKATLDTGHMLTVKWLRVGLVKHKKEFAKEIKKIGSARHPNLVPLRAYYWGPREQERLILADFIQGDSLSLHLYETTPRRYPPLAFSQRFKVAVDVARCLLYLHERGMPHGDLKPTNILLTGPNYDARLTDYCLHRLMTPAGIAEQVLNLGALGYRAPELASAVKPVPTLKADVYALGVILMELLTRRSAGDIFSGQSGVVDLTDWVRLCDQEGRGLDCIDRDIAGGEEPSKAMEECLSLSLRCILAVDERPNIRQVYEDLCSISV